MISRTSYPLILVINNVFYCPNVLRTTFRKCSNCSKNQFTNLENKPRLENKTFRAIAFMATRCTHAVAILCLQIVHGRLQYFTSRCCSRARKLYVWRRSALTLQQPKSTVLIVPPDSRLQP